MRFLTNEKWIEKGVSLSDVLECIVKCYCMTYTLNARFLLANEFVGGLHQSTQINMRFEIGDWLHFGLLDKVWQSKVGFLHVRAEVSRRILFYLIGQRRRQAMSASNQNSLRKVQSQGPGWKGSLKLIVSLIFKCLSLIFRWQ